MLEKLKNMRTRDNNTYKIDIWQSIKESLRFMEPVKVILYGTEGKVIMKL